MIKRLKELGKESFEEYARRMEAQWKAVEKQRFQKKAGLTSEGNSACPGTAAAAEAEVLTVSELLAILPQRIWLSTAWLSEAYKTQKARLDKGEN